MFKVVNDWIEINSSESSSIHAKQIEFVPIDGVLDESDILVQISGDSSFDELIKEAQEDYDKLQAEYEVRILKHSGFGAGGGFGGSFLSAPQIYADVIAVLSYSFIKIFDGLLSKASEDIYDYLKRYFSKFYVSNTSKGGFFICLSKDNAIIWYKFPSYLKLEDFQKAIDGLTDHYLNLEDFMRDDRVWMGQRMYVLDPRDMSWHVEIDEINVEPR